MKQYINKVAFFFRYAWGFSLFINISMLLSPLYMLQIYDRVLTSRSLSTLSMLSIGMVITLIVYTALEALRSRILVQAGLALDELLSPQALNEVFSKNSPLKLQKGASPTRDIAVLRQYLTGSGLFAFFDAPWGVIFLAIIFIMHWLLGVTALLGMIVLFSIAVLEEKRTKPLLTEASIASREANLYIDAALRNSDIITSMGMRSALINRWQLLNQNVLLAQSIASNRAGLYLATTKGIRTLLQTAMLGLGAYLVIAENLSSGIMIAATILLAKATSPIELAISGWKGFVEARAAYHRLNSLLNDSQITVEQTNLPAPLGKVQAERVVFGVSPNSPAIIKGVTFTVAASETLAIIGPSAAGKSTLLKILIGIWQPQSGEVRLDGANIQDWPDDRLGPFIGYLPQEVGLLSGTVAENIARLQNCEENSEKIVEAAQLAGAHEMILRLSQGYDTPIGENGTSLSGGQRQRIGLARAIYSNPKVVVLDEPNANLDSDGEIALIKTISQLRAMGTTVIFVTHKSSLVTHADKILVLENGLVTLFGNREQVTAQLKSKSNSNSTFQPAT